jgi:hypothetical protein
VGVPHAATILSAYQDARVLPIGRSVVLTNGKAEERFSTFGLMNYTG